jgi:uncharacterized membrane protein YeaQ/YmgE (transglycosylase-associated protein family)
MDSPLLNFVAAIGVGLVIGLIGGFMLRGRAANATMLAPVLGIVGALVASGAAYFLGEPSGYGWKEIAAQVVLAVVGVGIVAVMGGRARKPDASGVAR